MPDLSAVAAPVLEIIGPVVGRAVRAFVGTAVGMVTLCVLAVVGCSLIVVDDGLAFRLLSVLVCLIAFAVLGAMLSVKRAIGTALLTAFAKLGLGAKIARVLFERVLAVDENDVHAQRGVEVAKTAERVPLAQAEARLRRAVDTVLFVREGSQLGFFRRTLQKAAVDKVEQYTLAQFREAQAEAGGVDLIKVRDEVASRVDGAVVDTIEGTLAKTTALFVVGACVVAVAGTFGLHLLAHRLQ